VPETACGVRADELTTPRRLPRYSQTIASCQIHRRVFASPSWSSSRSSTHPPSPPTHLWTRVRHSLGQESCIDLGLLACVSTSKPAFVTCLSIVRRFGSPHINPIIQLLAAIRESCICLCRSCFPSGIGITSHKDPRPSVTEINFNSSTFTPTHSSPHFVTSYHNHIHSLFYIRRLHTYPEKKNEFLSLCVI
jgi:hypothetical protein